MTKAQKPKRKELHPTLFVFDGSIMHYEDGSMLELHSGVSTGEWSQIIDETIHYKCFLECLKDVAIPKLEDETWTEEDDWFRVQLDIALSRMRNLDALVIAKFDQKKIKEAYATQMETGVVEVQKLIEEAREEHKIFLKNKLDSEGTVTVSNL